MRLDVPPAAYYRGKGFFAGFDAPLRIIHVERGPSFPPHRHDFTELELSVEEMAAEAGTSPRSFRSEFKRAVGRSPSAYRSSHG